MPGQTFEAADKTIGAVFHDLCFVVPWYQRAYSWEEETAEQLLSDLLQAIEPADDVDDLTPYFLGGVVGVSADIAAPVELIDGQQRLATLTILLCAAREFVSAEFSDSLTARIFQPGDPILGTQFRPRLSVRERDQAFFQRNIQNPEGMGRIDQLALDNLPPSQHRLATNAIALRRRLAALPRDTVDRLVRYLNNHVHVIMVSATDSDTAFRIFNTLNDRGQSLTYADKLKAEVIGGIAAAEQDVYTRRWEHEEADLGAHFDSLFSHLRTIFGGGTKSGTILDDFRARVLPSFTDGRSFIDDCLVPTSDALQIILRSQYGDGSPADEVNALLRWMRVPDNTEWIPPTLAVLRRPTTTRADFLRFLRDLERLAAFMLVTRVRPDERTVRYREVLRAVRAGEDLYGQHSRLQLPRWECDRMLRALDAGFEGNYFARRYVVLRLDSILSSGVSFVDTANITVEHVLPLNPLPGSSWLSLFPDLATRRLWTDKLANLVLLTRRTNRRADRFDFDEKKDKYFRSRDGVSQSALTTQVLQESEWTLAVLERRQRELVAALARAWRLR